MTNDPTNSTITIREATELDIPLIIHFNHQTMLETENLDLPENLREHGVKNVFKMKSKYFKYFIALSDPKPPEKAGQIQIPVGIFMIQPEWSDWRGKWVVWLHSVYIVPQFRGQGIFDKMQNFLETTLRADPDVIGMRLYVECNNGRAKKAYLRANYNDQHYDLFEKLF